MPPHLFHFAIDQALCWATYSNSKTGEQITSSRYYLASINIVHAKIRAVQRTHDFQVLIIFIEIQRILKSTL
jgi:formate hydrogenlyase subunit 3/multisubunit Na+/H+ antiporter MnhD subunit